MITIHFPGKNIYKYFPEHLDECNEKEFISIARFAYAQQTGKISLEQFKTLTVFALLDIHKKAHKSKDEDFWANIAYLSELVNNFFEIDEENKIYRLNIDFLMPKIESFEYFKTKYYGPTDPLNHISFGQWIDATELILEHHQEYSEETFTRLLAILFLRKNEEYPTKKISEFIDKRTKHFKYIDKGIQYGVYLFFTSFMNYLNSASVDIAGNEIDLSIIFDNDSDFKSSIPSVGIRSTAHTIAQSGEFGDYEKVRQVPLGEIMLRMYEMKKNYLDEKAKSEKTK